MSCRCWLSLRTPEDPPQSSSRPFHFPFLFPLPHSSQVFPGRAPQTLHVSVSPLLASLSLPTFTPSCPRTQCLCPIYPACGSAPPARLSLQRGFSQGCALPSGSASRAPLSSGRGGRAPSGGARRRRRGSGPCALCSYWTGLCVPLSANDGAGGNWRPGPARSRDEAQTVSQRLWE